MRIFSRDAQWLSAAIAVATPSFMCLHLVYPQEQRVTVEDAIPIKHTDDETSIGFEQLYIENEILVRSRPISTTPFCESLLSRVEELKHNSYLAFEEKLRALADAADELFEYRISRIDYSIDDLAVAYRSLTAVSNAPHPPSELEELLRDEMEIASFGLPDHHATARSRATLLEFLVTRIDAFDVYRTMSMARQNDEEQPMLLDESDSPEELGTKRQAIAGWIINARVAHERKLRFLSPRNHFEITYWTNHPNARANVPSDDTAKTVRVPGGRIVTLGAGGGRFGIRNAPDFVEEMAAHLEAAYDLLDQRGFSRLQTKKPYKIMIGHDPLFDHKTYVSPVDNIFWTRPEDWALFGERMPVHEFMHQVQWNYGHNLGALFDDNSNWSNFTRHGRFLMEGLATALERHLYEPFPQYGHRTWGDSYAVMYPEFWSVGYNEVPYGFTMQAFTQNKPGDFAFGLDVAADLYEKLHQQGWRRDHVRTFIADRNSSLSGKYAVPRMYFLNELYGFFKNKPSFVAPKSLRLVHMLSGGRPRLPRNLHLVEGTKKAPGDVVRIVSTDRVDGSKEKWQAGKWTHRATEFPGVPHMVVLPVEQMPESLLVNVSVRYRVGKQVVSPKDIAFRRWSARVHLHLSTASIDDVKNGQFANNTLLESRIVGAPNPGVARFKTYAYVDKATNKVVHKYERLIRSVVAVFEWHDAPRTNHKVVPEYSLEIVPEKIDVDGDGWGDLRDNSPLTFDRSNRDTDSDGFGDVCDNCPNVPNWNQRDSDGDGIGDACDADSKPDLVISAASLPNDGMGIAASLAIRNIGSAPVRSPFLVEVSGVVSQKGSRRRIKQSFRFDRGKNRTIRPGEIRSNLIPDWILTPGTPKSYRDFVLRVDPDNDVEELVESNNTFQLK